MDDVYDDVYSYMYLEPEKELVVNGIMKGSEFHDDGTFPDTPGIVLIHYTGIGTERFWISNEEAYKFLERI
jgi:hypothetical protein